MGVQSLVSLVTIGLVVSRAVNILGEDRAASGRRQHARQQGAGPLEQLADLVRPRARARARRRRCTRRCGRCGRARARARPGHGRLGLELDRLLADRDLGADVARQLEREREVEQRLDARLEAAAPGAARRSRRRGPSAAAAAAPGAPTRWRRPEPARRRAAPPRRRGRSRPCPRRCAPRSGAPPAGRRRRAPSRARRAPAAARLSACQKASVIIRSTGDVRRVGVARVDQPLRGERVVALGERVLGRDHEALDAVGRRVGRREVDEAAGCPRARCGCPR